MPAAEAGSVPDQEAADDPQVCHGGHCAVPEANDPPREGASEGGDVAGGAPAGSSTGSVGGPGEAGAGGEASPTVPRKEWSDEELLQQCLSQMDDPEMCQMMVKVSLPAPWDLHRTASGSMTCDLTPAGRGIERKQERERELLRTPQFLASTVASTDNPMACRV